MLHIKLTVQNSLPCNILTEPKHSTCLEYPLSFSFTHIPLKCFLSISFTYVSDYINKCLYKNIGLY